MKKIYAPPRNHIFLLIEKIISIGKLLQKYHTFYISPLRKSGTETWEIMKSMGKTTFGAHSRAHAPNPDKPCRLFSIQEAFVA